MRCTLAWRIPYNCISVNFISSRGQPLAGFPRGHHRRWPNIGPPRARCSAHPSCFSTFPLSITILQPLLFAAAPAWIRRGLLALALLPVLGAEAQSLSYTPGSATNVAGTYTDLGAAGTAIVTTNTDDANSAAQDVGFTFNFNGTAFTQFVLNTNGFVRLGAAAPSAAALFLSETAANVDPILSQNPADVNILAPFNMDLTAGTGAGAPSTAWPPRARSPTACAPCSEKTYKTRPLWPLRNAPASASS